jgi:hypothetical protein
MADLDLPVRTEASRKSTTRRIMRAVDFWPVDLLRKSASLRLMSMRSDTIFLSINSDAEVMRSLPCRLRVQREYLDVTVLRRGVGEVRVVAGRAPACWQVWRGMQYRRSQAFNLRRLLSLKANEWLITTALNFHEWTWPTTAHLLLDCHF